jgi:sugar phosphate isomerase/epimerase
MKTSRRQFIQNSAVLLAGTALLSKTALAAVKSSEIIGLQLYSVRDDMKKDPLGTLKQLAQMGYTHVEHANYVNHKFYGYSAKEFRKILDDLGLKMPSGHTVMGKNHWDEAKKDFTDDWKYLVEDAAYMGQKYVISPWMDESMRKTYDDLVRYLDVFNLCGDLCKKSGMKFGYHNHWAEFTEKLNGEKLFDIMMQKLDVNKVVMQLDIGNMYIGGAKALDVIGQYPGKFELIHVKDEIGNNTPEKFESAILGKGIIPVKEVLDICRKTGGTQVYIIEQEAYQGKAPLDCVKEDLEIMKGWGYRS